MSEIWARIAEHLVDRVTGPMHLRIYMQPLMATVLATISGLQDARGGKPPYLWTLFRDPTQRTALLREGWKSIGKVFVVAILLDVVYQLVVLGFVFPLETIVVAIVLAIIPYLVVRGLVTRIAGIFV